ncbi:MAG: single-stranded DNA-binding protein [Oligosphaeraceae bacterium]
MPNLNRVFLMGRLTRDPSLNSSKTGTVFCRFSLAVNRRVHSMDGSQREEVEYIDVMFTGRLADFCQHSLRKGSSVFVEGRLHIESWVDAKTKIPRKNPVVYGESLQLLESHRGGGVAVAPGEVAPQVEEAFGAVSPRPSSPAPAPGDARPPSSRRPLPPVPPGQEPLPPREEGIF